MGYKAGTPEEIEAAKAKNNLAPVAVRLGELLNQDVTFVPVTRGKELDEAVAALKDGEVLLVQNTRYEKGDEVVVNYDKEKPFTYKGETIKPMGYKLFKKNK